MADLDLKSPVVVVSGDSHVGPLLTQQREYCPKKYLEQFDDYAKEYEARFLAMRQAALGNTLSAEPAKNKPLRERNSLSTGDHDVHVRLRDMDLDGTAAEVIFHGSGFGGPIPFTPAGGDLAPFKEGDVELELAAAGLHIYNQWLADFVSTAPDRLIGCAHVPIWDVDATVREVVWAREAGLQALNFPSSRPGIPEYDVEVWEPLWSACEALAMPMATHTGFGDRSSYSGRQAAALMFLEVGGWLPRRTMGRLIFGGVFERHPGLKMVITESPGAWWPYYQSEYDSSWALCRNEISEVVPRPPSEYMHTNLYHGASFMAHFEAERAIEDGYSDRVIWGRDYPHAEGTWVNPKHEGESSLTRESMRFCFAGLPAREIHRMVGQTGVEAYGLDPVKLASVAAAINAPTLEELMTPIDAIPEEGGLMAFRTIGAWA